MDAFSGITRNHSSSQITSLRVVERSTKKRKPGALGRFTDKGAPKYLWLTLKKPQEMKKLEPMKNVPRKIPFLWYAKYCNFEFLALIHLIGQGAFASNARLIFLSFTTSLQQLKLFRTQNPVLNEEWLDSVLKLVWNEKAFWFVLHKLLLYYCSTDGERILSIALPSLRDWQAPIALTSICNLFENGTAKPETKTPPIPRFRNRRRRLPSGEQDFERLNWKPWWLFHSKWRHCSI